MPRETEQSLVAIADRHFEQKEYAQALKLYEEAFALDSSDIEARTGIALSLVHLGNFSGSIPVLRDLMRILPDSEPLQIILGEALLMSGGLEEAEQLLTSLVSKTPRNIEALIRLGRVQMARESYPEANRSLSSALAIDPSNVEALGYMGLIMIKFCQFDDALAVLMRANALEPGNVLVLNNLGRACKMMGDHAAAIGWYRKALDEDQGNVCIVGNYLMALNYVEGLEPEYVSGEHFRLAPRYGPGHVAEPDPFTRRVPGERLRIGYLSGDFYTHSVSYFFEPVLDRHDRQRFETYCYSVGTEDDATTARLKGSACNWRELAGTPPEVVARQIRDDGIDILVDLSGHTADNRLGAFALRSAPVQVSWIGYPNTTGLPQMDYYLTDPVCDPPGMTEHLFSERLWRLPRVFCCYLPPMAFPAVPPLPCVTNSFITFGSFNNFAKVTQAQLALWGRILCQVPDSRLYLKSMALGDSSVKSCVLDQFAAAGVAPERIRMRTVTTTPQEHLAEYGQVDIALDTFPYHGTTTTCEALWMGTPVITLAGVTHASRVGVSLLAQTGCHDCIAASGDDYVQKAVALARDKARLSSLRERLRGLLAASPLMDAVGITREVEAAFEAMYSQTMRSNGPTR